MILKILILQILLLFPNFINFYKKEIQFSKIKNRKPTLKKELKVFKISKTFTGQCSYYDEHWDGRTTANMEIFDCKLLTAASPTLPFNTMVKVINLANNKSVILRINDRGPYEIEKDGKLILPLIAHRKRKLDLSKKAFSLISDLRVGILNVKIILLE